MKITTRAYLYLALSVLIGSFTPVLLVFTKGSNILELFLLAAVISVPFGLALVARKGKLEELGGVFRDKKRLFYMALAAILAYVTFGYGIAYAENFISASLTTVIFRLNPLLMLVFLPLLLKERLSTRQIVALILAFAGIALGIVGSTPTLLNESQNIAAIGFVVLLALGYALSSVIIKRQMLDNEVYIAGSAIVLTVFYALFFAATKSTLIALTPAQIGIVIYLALTNIFSIGMFTYALKTLKTTIVTNTYMLSPFFTFIWAAIVLGSAVQIEYIAIALLAGIGILIQRKDRIGGSYLTKHKGKEHPFTIFDVTGGFINSSNPALENVVRSGGRVFATKLHKKHSVHIDSLISENNFSHVYTGNEAAMSDQANFVGDVLGLEKNEALVIKAGTEIENDRFFSALSDRIGPME